MKAHTVVLYDTYDQSEEIAHSWGGSCIVQATFRSSRCSCAAGGKPVLSTSSLFCSWRTLFFHSKCDSGIFFKIWNVINTRSFFGFKMICFEWNFTHSTPITQATWFNTKVQVLRSSAVCVLMSLDVFSKLPFLLFWSLFSSFLFRWFRQWCGPSTSVGLCLGCRNQKVFLFCSELDFHGFPKQLDLPATNECSVPVCPECASVLWHAVALVLLVAVRRHRTLLHHKAAWSIHKGLQSAGGFIGPNYINLSFNHIQPYQKPSLQ